MHSAFGTFVFVACTCLSVLAYSILAICAYVFHTYVFHPRDLYMVFPYLCFLPPALSISVLAFSAPRPDPLVELNALPPCEHCALAGFRGGQERGQGGYGRKGEVSGGEREREGRGKGNKVYNFCYFKACLTLNSSNTKKFLLIDSSCQSIIIIIIIIIIIFLCHMRVT